MTGRRSAFDGPEPPQPIGVVGAGTMGAGIAQLACLAGARTLVHDPALPALERGLARVRRDLGRGAERGRWRVEDAERAGARLEAVGTLEGLAECALVVEAAPEDLDLKIDLFTRLDAVCGPDAVFATNTSSIPVTAIAAATARPARVVGMHFFNPAPLMELVEVVAGAASGEEALAVATRAGEAMGRRVIRAEDVPGFLVNRCNRPFGLEAKRLLAERVADVATIDRCWRATGFRMGPFELADLVGLDVSLEVSRSFHRLSFGEPRWRPSALLARTVAAGRLGRKTGHGWYAYPEGGRHREDDPPPPEPGGGDGLVVVAGEGVLAEELLDAAAAAGWEVATPEEAAGEVPALLVDCGAGENDPPLQGGPRLLLCAEAPLSALDPGGTAAGFHVLPPLDGTGVLELTRTATTAPAALDAARRFAATLGKHAVEVGDMPGLVSGRILCQVANEAAFAVAEGVGSVEDVDLGMRLGLNWPRGPLLWADLAGLDHVLAVLDGLHDESREERYRAAPLLRRLVREGRLGVQTGEGFHRHPDA